ncbi:hypothetical protein G3I40_05350 [Streptomyces sp. SID14478]|uniref:hypothetical protein n=1 Tax=Streptomyces sp. SID14478 TaxID=2706073 RepID=UPI0013DD1CE7|nr:hypothetical protein [Streptomyces sp. SID14478]NEB74660.1 hypothetical protein [Streptomyces sp. SID14478]
MPRTAREYLGTCLTLSGIAAAVPSVWHTFTHITDDACRTPELRYGERHLQYHMAREVLISAGALTAVGIGVLTGPGRSRNLWRATAAAAGGYCAALWSGGPTAGVWAPNRQALMVHTAATVGLLGGVALTRPRAAGR